MNASTSAQSNHKTRISFFRSLRGRLILLFMAVSLIPIAVVGSIAIIQLNTAKKAALEVTENYLPSIISLDNAQLALMHIVEAQKNHIIAPDDATRIAMENKIQKQQDKLNQALAGFETTLDESTETEELKKLRMALGGFLQANNKIISLSKINQDGKAQALSVGTANEIFEQAFRFMGNIRETNIIGSNQAKMVADTAARSGVKLTLIALLVVTFSVMLVAVLVANSIAKPVLILSEATHQLAAGNVELRGINRAKITKITARRDEMGNIGRAFDALASYFNAVIDDIVKVSQGLASGHLRVLPQAEYRGDFIQIKTALEASLTSLRQVIDDIVKVTQGLASGGLGIMPEGEYQGDFIQIKNALETAATTLAEVTTQNAQQDWLKTGQTQLNDQMKGEQDMVSLAKNIISFITTYIEAPVGLFYLMKSSQLNNRSSYFLRMIASYAYTACDNRPAKYQLGEGLIGQVAMDKKTLVLSQTEEECPHITRSGLSNALLSHILIIPGLYENSVKCVIEIGSANKLTLLQREFIEQAMPNIAIAINTAQSRARMQELLEKSQQQTEELQRQSEELQAQQDNMQQINKQLQVQQEELQQRNEELQNQSEELQTQQEELRESNDELETRTKDLEQQKQVIQQKNNVLEQNQAEMEKARAVIEAKAKELELASRYKSEFMANMSHELRTPLNSLLILAQLLTNNKPGNLTDKQVEYAKTIHSAGSDLLSLINDILDLSKVEAGKMEVHIEECPLTDLVEKFENKFRPLAENKGLEFLITMAENLPPVISTDVQRVQQIINNLLSNAFKFTEQGKIQLQFRPAGKEEVSDLGVEATNSIAIGVTDSGIGIPEDKKQIVFEAFQQADGTTSRRYGGTGLGLSISRRLARLLGGDIQLHSEEDKGSTFTLYLPKNSPQLETETVKEPQATGSKAKDFNASMSVEYQNDQDTPAEIADSIEVAKSESADDRSTLKSNEQSLLIIEDDQKFSDLLMELGREKHFKCLVAHDGRFGIKLAEQYQPNAILLSVNLHQIDGWTVLERLKDHPNTRHIPVYLFSATEPKNIQAIKMGAIGFQQKPANMTQLSEVFQKIEDFMTNPIKNLLVVVDIESHQQNILQQVESDHVQTTTVVTTKAALEQLKTSRFDCILLDMDIEQGKGNELLIGMQQDNFCQIPVIAYADRDLTSAEETLLLQCADTLPVKAVRSSERLLEEMTLFLHQEEANLSLNKRRILRMIHDKESILANKKVLIVDDDARNVFALATALEEKNMEVIAGNNGFEALELLEQHSDIAVVLMDIMMPSMDGYEATREIRKQLRYQKLPVIALTAKAMKGDKGKCIEAGANDYLSKPVDTDKLISLMRVWLYQ